VHGDEIEQTDARWLYGLDAAYQKSIHRDRFDALVTSGVQLRAALHAGHPAHRDGSSRIGTDSEPRPGVE